MPMALLCRCRRSRRASPCSCTAFFSSLAAAALHPSHAALSSSQLRSRREDVKLWQNGTALSGPGDVVNGRWGDGCRFVFLDIGANMGISTRKLFEPAAYPPHATTWNGKWADDNRPTSSKGKLYAHLFDQAFGTIAERSPRSFQGLCAFAFEPNIAHTARLRSLEACYASRGWRVKVFTRTAVSSADGATTFYRDSGGTPLAESDEALAARRAVDLNGRRKWSAERSSSIYRFPHRKKLEEQGYPVTTVDLAAWVAKHVVQRRVSQGHRPAYVLAKIDVEGAEFEVMPKLLAAGLLCADAISTITMEWHPGFLSLMGARERGLRHLPTAAEGGQLMQRVSSARASVPTAAGSTCSRKTTFESVDDETYLLDSKCSLRLHEEPSRVCSAPADKECAHMYPSADGPAA